MTGLTTIENAVYDNLIWPILTEGDDAYREFHRQLCHRSRIES